MDCLPLRHLRAPRKTVVRPASTKICANCGAPFPTRLVIDRVMRNLARRRFCLNCSPFGVHNTSKSPPGTMSDEALGEHRRKKRNAKTHRYQKKRRISLKDQLIAEFGGRCTDCGYAAHRNALEFHHLNPTTKEFTISRYLAQFGIARLRDEARKCVLLCANCHAIRHATAQTANDRWPIVAARRGLKLRSIAFMGSRCIGCGRTEPVAVFQFHHLDARMKEFGIGEDGRLRTWGQIVTELAKCVMLCANCHREVHAGARELAARISEQIARYAA